MIAECALINTPRFPYFTTRGHLIACTGDDVQNDILQIARTADERSKLAADSDVEIYRRPRGAVQEIYHRHDCLADAHELDRVLLRTGESEQAVGEQACLLDDGPLFGRNASERPAHPSRQHELDYANHKIGRAHA